MDHIHPQSEVQWVGEAGTAIEAHELEHLKHSQHVNLNDLYISFAGSAMNHLQQVKPPGKSNDIHFINHFQQVNHVEWGKYAQNAENVHTIYKWHILDVRMW